MYVLLKKIHICTFLINRFTQGEHPEVKGSEMVVKVLQGNEPHYVQWEIVAVTPGGLEFIEK